MVPRFQDHVHKNSPSLPQLFPPSHQPLTFRLSIFHIPIIGHALLYVNYIVVTFHFRCLQYLVYIFHGAFLVIVLIECCVIASPQRSTSSGHSAGVRSRILGITSPWRQDHMKSYKRRFDWQVVFGSCKLPSYEMLRTAVRSVKPFRASVLAPRYATFFKEIL